MVAEGHAWLRGACIGYNEIWSMSRQYASYWNAFLLSTVDYFLLIPYAREKSIDDLSERRQ